MGRRPGLSEPCPGAAGPRLPPAPPRAAEPAPQASQHQLTLCSSRRFNLDPFESHTDEMLWQVLERTFMRDTVGLGVSRGVWFTRAPGTWPGLTCDKPWASVWPGLFVGPTHVRDTSLVHCYD